MNYRYDEAKATQAAAYLIKKYGGELKYMKLIKLLYLADRKSIELFGTPIVPDTFVSMPRGPVLSHVLDAINSDDNGIWSEFITNSGDHCVSIKNDPGVGDLNRRSLRILDEVDSEWHTIDQYAICTWMHENLPEWEDPNGSSIPISPQKLMKAVGLDVTMIRKLIDEEKIFQDEDIIFETLRRGERVSLSCADA